MVLVGEKKTGKFRIRRTWLGFGEKIVEEYVIKDYFVVDEAVSGCVDQFGTWEKRN